MSRLEFLFTTVRPGGGGIALHRHECCELVYYYRGSGITRIGADEHAFQSGTFALMAPRVLHDERHREDSEVMVIGFHGELPDKTAVSGVYRDDESGVFNHLADRMKQEYYAQKPGYMDMLDLLIGELLIELRRLLRPDKSFRPHEDKLIYARNYMDEHFRQKISIAELAELSGYSYDRFRHLFKEMNGAAPLQYIFMKRMELARSLLLQSDASVSEIALEAGFVNDAQFCSMFKREKGETPRGYRMKHAVRGFE